jgi:hypothetical protein
MWHLFNEIKEKISCSVQCEVSAATMNIKAVKSYANSISCLLAAEGCFTRHCDTPVMQNHIAVSYKLDVGLEGAETPGSVGSQLL